MSERWNRWGSWARRQPLQAALVLVPLLAGLLVLATQRWWPGLGLVTLACVAAIKLVPYRLNPLTERKIRRFKSIRRGYWSFIALLGVAIFSLFAELFVGGRALVVKYESHWYFPVYGHVQLGKVYDVPGTGAYTPVNYRELKQEFAKAGEGNWVIMPLIPYSPQEQFSYEGALKPRAPGNEDQHYLGTDTLGRDILSRLVYAVRIAVFFSLAYTASVFLIGVTIGCLMGYIGKWFDLTAQRLVEIWSLMPFLYIVMIMYSLTPAGTPASTKIGILLVIMVVFGWMGMSYYMRTAMYREKARDYAAAAVLAGAGNTRIIFVHLLPNAISTIVTFLPFTVEAAITAITALDFLGFGLPPPTPSIGELLSQGVERLDAIWIVSSAFGAMVILLTLTTFVGEAVREAFDPKQFSYYR